MLGSLFVIGAGVVSLTAVVSEGEIELLLIGPGDHFGEIGMLTGQPNVGASFGAGQLTIYRASTTSYKALPIARSNLQGNYPRW